MGRTSAQSSFASDDDDPEVDVVPRDYYDEDDEGYEERRRRWREGRYPVAPTRGWDGAAGRGGTIIVIAAIVGARGRVVVIPTRCEEAVVDVNVVNDGDGGG